MNPTMRNFPCKRSPSLGGRGRLVPRQWGKILAVGVGCEAGELMLGDYEGEGATKGVGMRGFWNGKVGVGTVGIRPVDDRVGVITAWVVGGRGGSRVPRLISCGIRRKRRRGAEQSRAEQSRAEYRRRGLGEEEKKRRRKTSCKRRMRRRDDEIRSDKVPRQE
eukprot:768732-Hanusia_phi.AAC.3